jgi:hypothetical protein
MSRPTPTTECSLIVAYLRHMATLRNMRRSGTSAEHEVQVMASDIEAGFHLDPELNPAAAEAQREFTVAPTMETLKQPFVVKRPDAELAPPQIGEHGGMSLGAHHMPDVGAVMSVALHHPDGTTLISTFGWDGYAEFCDAMNSWGLRINAGEFNAPPVAQ